MTNFNFPIEKKIEFLERAGYTIVEKVLRDTHEDNPSFSPSPRLLAFKSDIDIENYIKSNYYVTVIIEHSIETVFDCEFKSRLFDLCFNSMLN